MQPTLPAKVGVHTWLREDAESHTLIFNEQFILTACTRNESEARVMGMLGLESVQNTRSTLICGNKKDHTPLVMPIKRADTYNVDRGLMMISELQSRTGADKGKIHVVFELIFVHAVFRPALSLSTCTQPRV